MAGVPPPPAVVVLVPPPQADSPRVRAAKAKLLKKIDLIGFCLGLSIHLLRGDNILTLRNLKTENNIS
jgi:hypothetical protein